MIDYTICKRRNGTDIVFCSLEELLLSYYSASSIIEVYPHLNGNGEYTIQCPFCREDLGYTKEKLYIKEDLSVGHCFRCTRAFVNITEEVKYDIRTPIADYNNFSGHPNVIKLTDETFNLDMYHNEFLDYDELGYEYLINKRHKFMDPLYKILKFKFWNHNIVMPFIYKGEVIYYQIRFINGGKLRYFFPKIENKPPYIIENGNNKKFIIVEGVYDAIGALIQSPDRTPFAVLGSSISDYQLDFLREYVPEDILIYMDDTHKSNLIRKKIKSYIDYCPIRVIRSNGQDPEEMLKYRLSNNLNLQWIK